MEEEGQVYDAEKPIYVRMALPSANEDEWIRFDRDLFEKDGRGFVPYKGESIWSTDKNNFKVGDGIHRWLDLTYFSSGGGGGGSLPDNIILDCGDATYNIEN